MINTSANLAEMILETAASMSLSSVVGELWCASPANSFGSATSGEITGSAGSTEKSEQIMGIRRYMSKKVKRKHHHSYPS